MPKPWRWRLLISQDVAMRNARHATAVLAQRRREREEVKAYLAAVEAGKPGEA
jgi:hypothetical protein